MVVPSSVLGQRSGAVPPSDRVVLGGIGIGARGTSDLRALLSYKQVQFVAICDVRNERREEIKSMVDKRYGNRDCAMYDDQYELLGREDIDAVPPDSGHPGAPAGWPDRPRTRQRKNRRCRPPWCSARFAG